MTKIKVSAYQFKTKEEATSKVDSIISHRKGRIDTIMKPQKDQQEKVDILTNKLDKSNSDMKKLDKEDEDYLIKVDKLVNFSTIVNSNLVDELKKLLKIKKEARIIRGRYPHKNKNVFANYLCIGKSSCSGQWVFSNQKAVKDA